MAKRKCDNESHPDRPAVAQTSWPDDRFKPGYACRSCLRLLIAWYVIDKDYGHALLISPLDDQAVAR